MAAKSDAQRQAESRARKKQKKVDEQLYGDAIKSKTEKEWHEKMRATLKPETLADLQRVHEETLDQLYWMRHWNALPANDPDYVSPKNGLDDLLEFVKEHPCPHLGYLTAGNLPPDWPSRTYWKDTDLLHALENESHVTMVAVRYGLCVGIPDWTLDRWLREEAKWSQAQVDDLLGIRYDSSANKSYYPPSE